MTQTSLVMDNNNKEKISPLPFITDQKIDPVKFEPIVDKSHGSSYSFKTSTLILTVLFVSLVMVAWFLFTGKAVYIDTSPDSASISIESGISFKLADRYLLRGRRYHRRHAPVNQNVYKVFVKI